jgi:hypothetical protein
MITYYDRCRGKQLNEIVIAGSHDAGINRGDDNVQTQSLDILGQAQAGVRVFDLRIALFETGLKKDGRPTVEQRAFHADGLLMSNKVRKLKLNDGSKKDVKITDLRGGDYGLGLKNLLGQARTFVTSDDGQTEFLILKFDKCKNWELIAYDCIHELGDALYTGGGNLNTKTVDELQRSVIVVFSPKGIAKLNGKYGPNDGILAYKNLYDKDNAQTYDPHFNGLQYFGKGGTNPFKNRSDTDKKIEENIKKQGKIMDTATKGVKQKAPGFAGLLGGKIRDQTSIMPREVVGMMYWTTTGLKGSIQKRNNTMWSDPNLTRLQTLWDQGLGDFVESHDPLSHDEKSRYFREHYIPNIIMIDFADETKCQTIYDLNLPATQHQLQDMGDGTLLMPSSVARKDSRNAQQGPADI